MSQKAHINLTLDEAILDWLDSLRGQKPRSTFINTLLLGLSHRSKHVFDWDIESELADEDIKKGRLKKFANAKDAVKWLKS